MTTVQTYPREGPENHWELPLTVPKEGIHEFSVKVFPPSQRDFDGILIDFT